MVDASQVPHVRYNLNEAWEFDIAAAAAQWNGIESPLFYYYPSFEQTEFGYLTLKKYDFSKAGWQDAPGVTFNNSYSQPHTTSDVYLNTDFNWNINGNMNQSLRKVDVRTIVVHEFGHSSGLTHPRNCEESPLSQLELNSAMHPNWTTKQSTNQDDWWGVESIYP
jgi:hypothetical protein